MSLSASQRRKIRAHFRWGRKCPECGKHAFQLQDIAGPSALCDACGYFVAHYEIPGV